MFSIKAIDDMLMIAPPPAARMDGATACAVKKTWRRFVAWLLSQYSSVTVVEIVPVVPGGIVDENGDRPRLRDHCIDRLPDRADIAKIGLEEMHRVLRVA